MSDHDPELERLRAATDDLAPPRGFAEQVRARVAELPPRSSRGAAVVLWRFGRVSLGIAAAAAALAIASAAVAEHDLDERAEVAVDLGVAP
jgi:hypothetical protein